MWVEGCSDSGAGEGGGGNYRRQMVADVPTMDNLGKGTVCLVDDEDGNQSHPL